MSLELSSLDFISSYCFEDIKQSHSRPEQDLASDQQFEGIVNGDLAVELPDFLELREIDCLLVEQELQRHQ